MVTASDRFASSTKDDGVTAASEIRAAVRRNLEEQRVAHLRRVDAARSAGVPDETVDPMDVGAQQALDLERDLEAMLDERTRRALDDVADALERLDAGTFGICDDCGGSIGQARLSALPHARRCLECQDRVEHRRG